MQEGTTLGQLYWLIRKNEGHVTVPGRSPKESASGLSTITVFGPFVTDQVREMVEQGMLDADDELCPENSYWFALHETAEMKRFLGVENMVVRRSPDEEATQPDLDGEETQPQLVMPPDMEVESNVTGNPESTGIIKINRPPKPAAQAPAKPVVTTAKAPTASELKTKYPRMAPPRPAIYANISNQEETQILGMEKGRFWGIVLIVFVCLAGIGVLWVIKSLRA